MSQLLVNDISRNVVVVVCAGVSRAASQAHTQSSLDGQPLRHFSWVTRQLVTPPAHDNLSHAASHILVGVLFLSTLAIALS